MSTENDNNFLNWLRAEMLTRGWSQSELAREIGVQASMVNRWMQGINVPRKIRQEQILLELTGKTLLPNAIAKVSSQKPLTRVNYVAEDDDLTGVMMTGEPTREEMEEEDVYFLALQARRSLDELIQKLENKNRKRR